MVKTKATKRSLSSYDVQRVILGVLLVGLIMSAGVLVFQNRNSDSVQIIDTPAFVEENADPAPPPVSEEGEQ